MVKNLPRETSKHVKPVKLQWRNFVMFLNCPIIETVTKCSNKWSKVYDYISYSSFSSLFPKCSVGQLCYYSQQCHCKISLLLLLWDDRRPYFSKYIKSDNIDIQLIVVITWLRVQLICNGMRRLLLNFTLHFKFALLI